MKSYSKHRTIKKIAWSLSIAIAVILVTLGSMIAFFPPKSPPPLEAIAAPFRSVDFSGVPQLSQYLARDGTQLAYRAYLTRDATQKVVLIHGSSGSSLSMHPLAESLQKQGMTAYALDIRGHGDSGPKGDIAYIGQLEDDLEDFMNQVLNQGDEATLIGFSAGGGFALRFAGSSRQKLFARYILLAPYIGYDSPTVRPNNGGWVDVSMPRMISILLLGSIGEKLFGHLPVIAYAVDPQFSEYLTARYSYRLLRNFSPHHDYRSDMINAKQPMIVLVGEDDELFFPDAYEPLFVDAHPQTKVLTVPGAGHITLTTGKSGISAIAKAIAP
jgi:alpha-beta hydrolase superfamily lysophospholipase